MKPTFGSGLLFDSYNETANKKINGLGAINIFRAWGFPSFRQATALISIFNLRKGSTTGEILLKKPHAIDKQSIRSFTVTTDSNNSCMTAVIPLSLKFNEKGRHFIYAIFHDYKSTLKIPCIVELQKWPTFSQEERQFVRKHRNILLGPIRTNLTCQQCSHAYIFEENILEEVLPPGGVTRFPKSGEFECTECNETIYLKDIQGQIRFSLKQMLSNIMRGQ